MPLEIPSFLDLELLQKYGAHTPGRPFKSVVPSGFQSVEAWFEHVEEEGERPIYQDD